MSLSPQEKNLEESKRGPVAGSAARVLPTPIIETTFDFARSCILLAAIELDLFTWIARGAHSARALAERADAAQSALEKLLGALCAMNFLELAGEDEYHLTPVAERFLVRDRVTYLGDVVLQIRQEWDAWIHLTEVVRTGRSFRRINEETTGGAFFTQLSPLLFPIVYPLMQRVCARLGIGSARKSLQIADLGAGTAPAAIAALELDPGSQAVAIDFAEVLQTARLFAEQHGVQERLTLQSGDLEKIELPAERFDLIFASHTFRLLGAEITRRLIAQSFQALRPGGLLVVIETYNDPDRNTALFPHIVTLNMMVNTRQGEALVSHHVQQWLTDAGFQVEVWADLGPDLILVGRR
jgi:ubiquinone/menaquinone biosynthesis C-methylase UbiE